MRGMDAPRTYTLGNTMAIDPKAVEYTAVRLAYEWRQYTPEDTRLLMGFKVPFSIAALLDELMLTVIPEIGGRQYD